MISTYNRTMSGFSNSELSKKIAEDFLRAFSTEEVNNILGSCHEFGRDENWRPYGGAEKNWDRVGVQTSEPVGALAELIINSIDAILMRRAKEENIDLQSETVPKSMTEAVKRFFPEVQEGRLTLLSQEQRTRLAEKSVLIGVKRTARKNNRYPNYTIVDFGEGQNHGNFEQTFLSLGEKNKEGIPFVQGRFNMGSTGSITFCTRAEIRNGLYKFILSKKATDGSDGLWGWTLIRVRKTRLGEDLPVVEYFCPDGEIACFESDEVQAFNRDDIGVIKGGGSVVKLYEYDIGPGARAVDIGLYDALTTSLIDCALPLRLYDFDAKPMKKGLRAEGIAPRTFSGMKTVLKSDDEEDQTSKVDCEGGVVNSDNPSLGTIRISYFGLDKMKDYLRNYQYRMFYTINGQAQGKERTSFLRKARLDDLRNHLIVQINCNSMDNTARSAIFKPDRERMADIELTRELKKIVVDALSEDGELRRYAREIRNRRISEQIEDETSKKFLSSLIKNSPDLQELFDIGNNVENIAQTPGGEEEYKGKKFPTYLTPINLEENGVKSVPINTYRRIECRTDVQNDYLIREANRGNFVHPPPDDLPNSGSLRNGKFRIKVSPPLRAKEGDEIPVQFGFDDSNPETPPLLFDVTVKITGEEQPKTSPGGGKTDTRKKKEPDRNFPDIEWVQEKDWSEHGYDEESGGHVSVGEELTVYVNKDNKYLLSMISREQDEGKREIINHRFRFGVGILTLAMYKKLVHDVDKQDGSDKQEEYNEDKVLRIASSAIAAHVVTLIERLGGDK